MPQTTVGMRQRAWLGEGQIPDTAAFRSIEGAMVNYPNGIASGILPFGRVLHRDSVTGRVDLPSGAASATKIIVGVSVMTEKYGLPLATALNAPPAPAVLQTAGTIAEPDVGYPPGSNVLVEVLPRGDILMWTEEALEPQDIIAYRHTVNGPLIARGRVRKGFTAAPAGDQVGCELLNGARAVTKAAANGLVIVRLGIVSPTAAFSAI